MFLFILASGIQYINDLMNGLLKKNKKIFFLLSKEHDNGWTFIDGSIVKAHQQSSGVAHGAEAAIGKSVAGNTTKIHLAVDAMGLPICFTITGGEVHDSKETRNLINKIPELEIVVYGCQCKIFMKTYFVYIMANCKNGTLYLGVTNNFAKRAWEHKIKLI